MSPSGLLLVNLGTPDAPEPGPVRRYLGEFLSDPRVLDINPVGRFLLLHLIILRFRPRASAEAYEKVWTDRGSPLLFHGLDLARKVQARVGEEVRVELGMRYGSPSIADALDRLREAGVDRVGVFPLFPHGASSSWGSAVDRVYEVARKYWDVPSLLVVPPYFDASSYVDALADVSAPALAEAKPDRVLISFHGVPERHCRKSDTTGGQHCLARPDCCDSLSSVNRNCYRAQCFATARALAARLDLEPGSWELAFQSRFGRDPWIPPFTDERVRALPGEGVRRLAVLSPAFVADCVETIEELGIRAREDFLAAGGEELVVIPALNSAEVWADAVVELSRAAGALV